MLRIVACVSGGGTNLQSIMDSIASGGIPNAEIVKVISNRPDAYALERAGEKGIEGICVNPKDFSNKEEYSDIFLKELDSSLPDLIVLAGFMVILPAKVVRAYANRIINVHPSLIPSFCGKGYYGLKVHEAVLERGVKVTGATVHFVDEGTDTGPIILQKVVEVRENDTPETLSERVKEEAEWKILPQAIAYISEKRVQIHDRKVTLQK